MRSQVNGLPGTGPGIREVDVDERGLRAEADAALEAALAIAPGRFRERGFERFVEFV